ncbi:polyamine ABC transporter substrate-binding protein [Symbioplanes lichenis]|uniref:polyamine ABC transporter substrate-binding protein n=1 Tax=Symbioplanes lichenis TaxID=1629072 RepID=UPI002739FE4E|nr:spermidine/putrescine ABC transporter substrate-binding protein [Actinoplanes lichenis]
MSHLDPALVRGLTTRRGFLTTAGLAATGALLAACGVKGQGSPAASAPAADEVAKFWAGKTGTGSLNVASWPLYMDPEQPELKKFTAATGIKVNYQEVIQEMGPWFAKVQPQLAAKQDIGYDAMIITNGSNFAKFRNSGFLAPLDHGKLPNYVANADPSYAKAAYDPGNVYSIPWASGITGIAYDESKTGPITSIADLWNPKFKGKVGMFSDAEELGNYGLLAIGVKPEDSTPDDWRKAAEKLKEQKSSGVLRNYYDQSYIDALGKGEVWLTQAWSGDVFQKNVSDGTNYKFVIPAEGGTIWTDNFTIPVTAKNPVDALTLMDFFYQVPVSATLAEYINYVCPVPAAQEQITKDAAAATGEDKATLAQVAASPLVFPAADDYARLHYYVPFASEAEHQEFQNVFEPVVLG